MIKGLPELCNHHKCNLINHIVSYKNYKITSRHSFVNKTKFNQLKTELTGRLTEPFLRHVNFSTEYFR